MIANYDVSLVLSSYAVAVLAAYTALYFGAQLAQYDGGSRRLWLVIGALAMGTGIWTMHFVGMRASSMMADMTFGAGLTLLSWLAAVLAAGVALHLIGRKQLGTSLLVVASLVMGSGIVAMHYVGMYAMNMSAAPVFNTAYLLISIVIAVVASGLALAICRHVRQVEGLKAVMLQFAAALVMAAAICGMHYTGMLAMVYPQSAVPAASNALEGEWMGIPLAMLCSVLLVIAIAVTAIDIVYRRRARLQAEGEALWVESAAFMDEATGLPNRSGLEHRIVEKLARPEAGDNSFAIIFLDVANHRELTSGLDGTARDELIDFLGARIGECLGQGVYLARYSTSSFMLMVDQHESPGHAFMYKRLRQLKSLRTESGAPVRWRAGQSAYPDTGNSSRRLIRAAMVSRDLSVVGSFQNLADDPTLVQAG